MADRARHYRAGLRGVLVYLPPEQHEALKRHALAQGRPLQEVVGDAISTVVPPPKPAPRYGRRASALMAAVASLALMAASPRPHAIPIPVPIAQEAAPPHAKFGMSSNGLHVGDALTVLRTFPTGSHQTCVTSPPYFGLRDYGVDGQIGQEPTPTEYVANIVEVMREVSRVLTPDGTLWLNLGDCYVTNASTSRIPRAEQGNGRARFEIPGEDELAARRAEPNRATPLIRAGLKKKDLIGIPWRVAFALQADGWYLRSAIIWHKPNPMPENVTDRPTSSYETVFLLSRSDQYHYDADAIAEPAVVEGGRVCGPKTDEFRWDGHRTGIVRGDGVTRNARNVWTIAPTPFRGGHFATMPIPLAERCIQAGSRPGDRILDPFGGSGTTAFAAQRLGRLSTLIELNPDYAEIARERLGL